VIEYTEAALQKLPWETPSDGNGTFHTATVRTNLSSAARENVLPVGRHGEAFQSGQRLPSSLQRGFLASLIGPESPPNDGVGGEARRDGARWELVEGRCEFSNFVDRPIDCGDVIELPVPEGVRGDVRALVGILEEVKDLLQAAAW
jgi:hypothetical protein